MSTQPTQPQTTPRRAVRRLRAITSTLAVVVALCTLSATGATAAAAEPSAPARVNSTDPASPASAPTIRAGTPTNRSYWCVPDATRSGPSSRVGFDNEDDDLDDRDGYDDGDADLTELVDLVDNEPTSRSHRDRGRDSTIWLDSGHGRQWPLDLGALGIRVRIGSPGESRYTTSPSKQLTRSDPGKLRCRVTPSSQTRTDRDNQRWACVLTDRDRDTQLPRPRGSSLDRPTNRTGGPIIIMRDQQRPSDRDWPDEQLSPGDRNWWPNAGDRPRLLMPSLDRSTSTPAAGNGRCLVMYSGEDGVEVHLGQLSKVTPPK